MSMTKPKPAVLMFLMAATKTFPQNRNMMVLLEFTCLGPFTFQAVVKKASIFKCTY